MEQQPMTMAERQKMFAKDYLDRFDLGKLIGVSPCEASVFIQEIKRCTRDRLHRRGKIHVQDYFDYYGVDPRYYYNLLPEKEEKYETANSNPRGNRTDSLGL